MNAYELADKLDDSLAFLDAMNTQYKNGFGKYRLLPKEVATMLRQQADRIAELEKDLHMIERHYDQLDKDVSSKPVAWKIVVPDNNSFFSDEPSGIIGANSIPLYTATQSHPVKHEVDSKAVQLSDEDIRKAFNEWLKTDEGVIKFDMQLNPEWVDEQWKRWEQAFKEITE